MDKQTMKWWVERSARLEDDYNATATELLEYKKALNHAVTALVTAGWMLDKGFPSGEVLEVIDDAIMGYRGFVEERFPNE